ncbi:MAG: 2Fe-2S iron-sulfur cluster-binding protein [Dehalococcoidia bacterium]|nr:2Fe-2S iron-sulfur cluster-binding protein [Dehalococcoidia bacterium]MDD5494991.1 2Fe-2S iron-sulfur cluster-binding protein [Dehalococcoidia bacterium]
MVCTVIIEGREIRAASGANLLWTALDNGFYIPNLCIMRNMKKPPASCRLCFVEVDGISQPVTACTAKVKDGMTVKLESPAITRLRKAAFHLLLSDHRLDCTHCIKNKHCELHDIAHRTGLKLNDKSYRKVGKDLPVDSSHPDFTFDPNKCVLCGRCVWVCSTEGKGVLDFAYRGIKTIVSTFAGMPLAQTACNGCIACAKVCPVGALYVK